MDMNDFKAELARQCDIHIWNPTDAELKKIAFEIDRLRLLGREITKGDLSGIITKHTKVESWYALEGVDNSDLKTLLMLATKVK